MKQKSKFIDTVWQTYSYDIWGNTKDGFEVNQTFESGEVELRLRVQVNNTGTSAEYESAYPSDKQIREALGIRPRVKIDTDGDDLTIYVEHGPTGEPLGKLHCVSHDSLSPIRENKPETAKESKPVPRISGKVSFEQLAARYCATQEQTPEGLRADLRAKISQYKPDGFMLLECQLLDSSRLGDAVILPYGPNNTYKAIPTHPVSPRGLASDRSVAIAWIDASDVW